MKDGGGVKIRGRGGMLGKMEVCAWELTRSRLSWRVGTHVVIIITGEVSHLILLSV